MCSKAPREQGMRSTAVFLIPAAKLQYRYAEGLTLERRLHNFLLPGSRVTPLPQRTYSMWALNFSLWGIPLYGEHREYRVFLNGEKWGLALEHVLAEVASQIEEQCIWFANGHGPCFIFPQSPQIESCGR